MHKYLLQILKFPLISLSFLDLFAFSYALTVLFPLILIKLNFKHFSTVRFCSIFLFLSPFFPRGQNSTWNSAWKSPNRWLIPFYDCASWLAVWQFSFTVLSICVELVTYFYLCRPPAIPFHLPLCKFLHNPRAKFLTEINSFYFAVDKLGPRETEHFSRGPKTRSPVRRSSCIFGTPVIYRISIARGPVPRVYVHVCVCWCVFVSVL